MEEREVLAEIYGTEFEVVGGSEWRIAIPGPPHAPAAVLHVLLPYGYPRCDAPPVPVIHSDCATEAFSEASASAVQELMSQWEPGDEGCMYQWAETLRDALRPALEDAAGSVLAQTMQDEEVAAAVAEAEDTSRAFTFLPANPQYGQRRRQFDDASFDDANKVDIQHGEPIVDRKSTFQAHAARVASHGQVQWVLRTLLMDRKIGAATHNIFAYRFHDQTCGALIADNEDDGEDTAGTKLAELLSLAGCDDVFVMVSRWYGGIHLGSDRFKHILRAASAVLEAAGLRKRGAGGGGTHGSKARAAGTAKR